MVTRAYGGTVLTGEGEGALDRPALDGDILNDLDLAFINTDGILYPYQLDEDSGLSADSPNVIPPGTNPGIKNWTLQGLRLASMQADNIKIDGNTISSVDTDGNIYIMPDGSGFVGINTTTPQGSFHVYNDNGLSVKMILEQSGATYGESSIKMLTPDVSWEWFIDDYLGGDLPVGALSLWQGGIGSRLMVSVAGLFGFNTTDPKTLITMDGTLSLKEQAAADDDSAGYGQLWMKTATPNQLWFTDDTGVDIQLGIGNVAKVGTPAANQIAVWTGDGTVEGTSALTFDGADLLITANSISLFDNFPTLKWIPDDDGGNIGYFVFRNDTNTSTRFLMQYEWGLDKYSFIGASGGYIFKGGNIGIETSTFDGSAVNVLAIANGTAPAAGTADQTYLYSVAGEGYWMDDAGNATLQTPHNKEVLANADPSEPFPFSYSSKNVYLGKEILLDMTAVVREVEKLSGKTFITVRDIPMQDKRDWRENQEVQRAARQNEINAANARIDEIDAMIIDAKNGKEIAELTEQKNNVVVPDVYTKKQPPQWLQNRGISLN